MSIIVNPLPAGTLLKGKFDYRIERALGQGSFGITYLATVSIEGPLGTIETPVAIKEFYMKEVNGREGTSVTSGSRGGIYDDYRRKFKREAQNLSKLKHPNIIKVSDAFETNNTVYYVMEYLGAGSLDNRIMAKGRLSEEETLTFAKQIGSALSFMHDQRMLHLDLKPANIMINDKGEAVLIDFGLSKQYDPNGEPESSTTVGGGTKGYAPIEQANYHAGNGFPVTMDVYAFGATIFKMLTGQVPPDASDVLNDKLPIDQLEQAKVSKKTISLVSKAMQPVKKNRYQTVEEMLADISMATSQSNEETSFVDDEQTTIDNSFQKKEETKDVSNLGKNSKVSKRLFNWWVFIIGFFFLGFIISNMPDLRDPDRDGELLTVIYLIASIIAPIWLYKKGPELPKIKQQRIKLVSIIAFIANGLMLPIWNYSLTMPYFVLALGLLAVCSIAFGLKAKQDEES